MPILSYAAGSYKNSDAADNVINYIFENHPGRDLIMSGSADLVDDPEKMVTQIECVQNSHRSIQDIGKRMAHSVIQFSLKEAKIAVGHPAALNQFAELCSSFYHAKGFQNAFGIYQTDDGQLEAHFAINPVNFITRKKYRFSNNRTDEEEETFNFYWKKTVGDAAQKAENTENSGQTD